MKKLDVDKYIVLQYSDMIPDTNLDAYIDYDTYDIYVIDSNLDIDTDFGYMGKVATVEYYQTAKGVESEYLSLKSSNDSIRSDDSQYECPTEWSLKEKYNKYFN